ncbi:MAG TPA: ligase-associated DNA damage response endonuclease PdeM [Gemmatimonadales bacterium]|nr:ligase-associated DNA damage response endonuclease PdeM [Gemmatimonadales bacterium]
MSDAEVRLGGEQVVLLAERALFWPRAGTLVAADLHWGKAAAFRAAGIPVPVGATSDDLARLDAALFRTCARRLIVLGDLFHAKAGRIASQTLAELRRWRSLRAELEILLVRGNHDRHAGDPPDDLRINCVNAPAFVPPFVLRHEPTDSPEGYTLAGHLHPGIVLAGPALQRARLPCFWLTPRGAVLPAFGGFTGLAPVHPGPDDRIFVIAEHEVIAVA